MVYCANWPFLGGNMKSISLYVDKNSFLNRLEPFNKVFYILTAIIVPLFIGELWAYYIFIGLSLLMLLLGKTLRRTIPLIAFSFTILITIFLIHGLFHQGNINVLFSIGSLKFYEEGIMYALRISLNILNMLLSFAIFVLTTKPSDLVEDMERIGFSPRFGYIIASVFQIIPQMIGTMSTITDAQRSRGLETEGSLIIRAKAFIPLIAPVVMSSLSNTRERAIALEVRGFESRVQKTFLYEKEKSKSSIAIRVIMIITILAALGWRVYLWLS